MSLAGGHRRGYAWALSAGLNAALAAVSAKFVPSQFPRYGLVILFNVIMWGCYVNSLKALSSLQATVTNFAANFLTSGLAGFFLFKEPLSSQLLFLIVHGNYKDHEWFVGAFFIILGVFVLSKSSSPRKLSSD
ncbi:cell growth defect factor 2 [Musa troglodytarum]|uniref:Cell growth defect factor 2 n=1 Tax=Musa troglodytarum TaxID=320322 RepID=A0A9E7EMA7_9LILI|nr:cell growth defect factor 2 [Musa troglodytarum]